jgi:predicted ATPase/class 3 adenylate cyclase
VTTTAGLLITDIEGSTRLLQQLGPAYGNTLEQHNEILRSVFGERNGTEEANEGDSFFVTFPTASDVVSAALEAQQRLQSTEWRGGAPVQVRMGVHFGEVERIAGSLIGMAIHETARISAAAHGGQVLASSVAVEVAQSDAISWVDLGRHHLKDLPQPTQIFQLTAEGLRSDFPPIRARGTGRVDLPAQASSFIGREREVAEIRDALSSSRLVTITGAGGSGKTRIALRAAADDAHRYNDGVAFVDLATIGTPTDVVKRFVQAASLSEEAMNDVAAALAEKEMLLVVDNCEHVLDAVAEIVTSILARCADVTILATSREPIGITGETILRLASLAKEDATQLFFTRALSVNSSFRLTDANRATIADIVDRLDALPLALELAAARVGSVSVEQLSERLDQRFRLLVGSTRGTMERHRTLQAMVDWSYDLLDGLHKTVLRRLSACVGGFQLTMAEALCDDIDPMTVFDALDQLVAKSLVVAETQEGGVRYRLLETIRQYAFDRMSRDEAVDARDRHLRAVVALAAEAEPALWFGSDVPMWLARLDIEDGNFRSALEWSIERGDVGAGASILMGAMMWLTSRGRGAEGLAWTRRVEAAASDEDQRALFAIMTMYFASMVPNGITPAIVDDVRRYVPVLATSAAPWMGSMPMAYVAAWSYTPGDASGAAAAVPECERAVEVARAGTPGILAWVLQTLLWTNLDAGNLDAARIAGEESAKIFHDAGLSFGESRMELNLARVARAADDTDRAWNHASAAVELARSTGDTFVVLVGMRFLADVAVDRGDPDTARDLLYSALDIADRDAREQVESIKEQIASL